MIKEGLKMLGAAVVVSGIFTGVLLISNYLNYGTFLF